MTDDEWEILKPAAAALVEAQLQTSKAEWSCGADTFQPEYERTENRLMLLRAKAEEEVAQQHYDMARIQNRKRGMS